MIDDGLPTPTSAEQAGLERRVLEIYGKDYAAGDQASLGRQQHPPPNPPSALVDRAATADSSFDPPLSMIAHCPQQAGLIPRTTA